MSKNQKPVIIEYDSDHSVLDYVIDQLVAIAVKLNNPKIYRYYPPDQWWDDRQSFFILGAENKDQAFEKIVEEAERIGFTAIEKELYG